MARRPLLVALALLLSGCAPATTPVAAPPAPPQADGAAAATLPAPAAVSTAARRPWSTVKTGRRAPVRFTNAVRQTPVSIKADLSFLVQALRKKRKLQGLGFRDASVASWVVTAHGPGIAPDELIQTVIPAGNPAPLSTTADLAVPPGPNRLIVLEARDAAGTPLARVRTVAAVTAAGPNNLTFDYRTDAAGRVLEHLLFHIDPDDVAGNPLFDDLATTDISAGLIDYVNHFTGYNPATNEFTGVNPLYFKDWVVAMQMVADMDDTLVTDGLHTNPGAAGTPGDVAVEARTTLGVEVFAPGNPGVLPGDLVVKLLDPVDRGAANVLDTDVAAHFPKGRGIFPAVPPGEWIVVVQGPGGSMFARFEIGVPNQPQAVEIHLPFVPSATPVDVLVDPAPPPPPPPAAAQPLALNEVVTFAGSGPGSNDGPPLQATFSQPHGLHVEDGHLYVADTGNNLIRKIALHGEVETIIGSGVPGDDNGLAPLASSLLSPNAVDLLAGRPIFLDAGHARVRFQGADDLIHQFNQAGGFDVPTGLTTLPNGDTYVAAFGGNRIYRYNSAGVYLGETVISQPKAITSDGNDLYVATGDHQVWRLNAALTTTTVIGGLAGTAGTTDGGQASSRFSAPGGLAIDPVSKDVFVADTGNHRIRKLHFNGSEYVSSTLAGTVAGALDGIAAGAKFNTPCGLAYVGGHLFIADKANHRIRRMRVF